MISDYLDRDCVLSETRAQRDWEGQHVVPFGFGRIDTKPGAFEFSVFDHAGQQRFSCLVPRDPAQASPPVATAVNTPKSTCAQGEAKTGKATSLGTPPPGGRAYSFVESMFVVSKGIL